MISCLKASFARLNKKWLYCMFYFLSSFYVASDVAMMSLFVCVTFLSMEGKVWDVEVGTTFHMSHDCWGLRLFIEDGVGF